jgi:type II secretory pathway predicted ATPase ExeA
MTDYKTFFGLSRAPFVAPATGTDVFVAPQVATSMAAIKKALAAEDAVITVTGPVGAGKTTVTRRTLESAAKFHIVVTIGRIQFGHDEVLELLLAGLGVRQLPKSTVHRFATFRRVLQQYAEQNTRVFILVEDATRVGFNALSELEAVTAADAGVSGGANLVLLGDESLPELLRDPKLARLKQRIRARQKIAAQSAGELQGYLKHCFRLAGKEFDSIFATDCCAVLHSLSDGIPRIANSLVTATLGAAAEQGLAQIDAALIERIASDEFGLTGDHKVVDIQAAFEPVSADVDFAEPKNVPEPAAALQTELVPAPEPEPEPVPEPALQTAEIPAPDGDIPELIQDTLPDLQILAPQLLGEDEATLSTEAHHEADQTPSQLTSHDPTGIELPILTGV